MLLTSQRRNSVVAGNDRFWRDSANSTVSNLRPVSAAQRKAEGEAVSAALLTSERHWPRHYRGRMAAATNLTHLSTVRFTSREHDRELSVPVVPDVPGAE
jgi:hypothetical protein